MERYDSLLQLYKYSNKGSVSVYEKKKMVSLMCTNDKKIKKHYSLLHFQFLQEFSSRKHRIPTRDGISIETDGDRKPTVIARKRA